ncbi:MAG: DNA alkylation repair protein [Halanaerobiales bacterium]|nr:DNA alkylation repair protein [Halanaerobiales bacterium]
MLKLIEKEFAKIDGKLNSKKRSKVQRKLYKKLPDNNNELIELFDELVTEVDWHVFWLVTIWIKRKQTLYQKEFMSYYENWLFNHINSWGSCDVFCYRVLNPMLEKYPDLYENILSWANSDQTYVRRAAPVSLLESTRSFKVNYSFSKVIKVVNKLNKDKELHVQKAVGWLLKYTYLSYPEQTYEYLKKNVNNMPRIVFRYALEKMPDKIKEDLMSL